jgi:peptide chain release factor 3
MLVRDRYGAYAVLFENEFTLRYFLENQKEIELVDLLEENDYQGITS